MTARNDPHPGFPHARGRRLRRTPGLRSLAREHAVTPGDLVLPLFAVEGTRTEREVSSMPGVHQQSVDRLVHTAERAAEAGLGGVLLFGVPETKDPNGTGAWAADGIIQRAVRAIKDAVPELVVITDVCLCEYTDHGQCGVVRDGVVDNDPTLPLLARTALSHVEAGADVVAPSDMMDGRVGVIRRALEEGGYPETVVLSYAVKYASALYGPFRDAAESVPAFGDRRGYQMDPANGREARVEAARDVAEGADILMVKPAGPYLDVVADLRRSFDLPVWAYQVSGEYSMVMAAERAGWLDSGAVLAEMLVGMRRAGADRIVTYHALAFADALNTNAG